MTEEKAEYAAGAGAAELAPRLTSRLSTRTDLDISIKRLGGQPSATLQHGRVETDRIYMDRMGVFVGAIWLSWEEVGELQRLLA